jgi:hypothetical protein
MGWEVDDNGTGQYQAGLSSLFILLLTLDASQLARGPRAMVTRFAMELVNGRGGELLSPVELEP